MRRRVLKAFILIRDRLVLGFSMCCACAILWDPDSGPLISFLFLSLE